MSFFIKYDTPGNCYTSKKKIICSLQASMVSEQPSVSMPEELKWYQK